MPRIDDVIKNLWISKQTFSRYYEKVMWKKMTEKTDLVSDPNLYKIQKLLEKNWKIKWTDKWKLIQNFMWNQELKLWTSKKSWESKSALKSDELKSGGWFFAWMWFNKTIEQPVVEDDPDEYIIDFTAEENEENQNEIERIYGWWSKKQDSRVTLADIIWATWWDKPAPITFGWQKSWNKAEKEKHWGKQRHTNWNHVWWNITIGNNTYTWKPHTNNIVNEKLDETKHNDKWHKDFNDVVKTEKQVNKQPIVKRPKEAKVSGNLIKKQEIIIWDKISVKEFSEKMWVPLQELMKVLMQNKLMLWITASLDFDTAALIAEEFNVTVKREENKQLDVESFITWDLQSLLDMDKEAKHLEERSPVVTVMWHVDHGKTSLLDYLRRTSVANKEAGWITQSIWASVVECNGKKITFIDTPGHELFTDLRARWAKLTNIAVIVVAADDSVMPQTIESINHAKSAWVPIIIAITKVDRPWKNIEQIKTDLAANWVTPEDWWWETPIIPISSKTWQGINDLLDAILLQAEVLELKYNPDRSAIWVVLDANKDPKQWVITSMIVLTWTLKVWDVIVAYNTYWRVRRMQDWTWKIIRVAKWWDPVQILWITNLPEAGRMVEVVKNEKEAEHKISLIEAQESAKDNQSVLQDFISKLSANADEWEKTELRLILKSDWSSSLSALKQAVEWVKVPDNVVIKVIHSDVWYFSDSDLSLAQASKALLLWFNIWVNAVLKKKAEQMKVEIKNFDIIYELTNYLTELTQWMIKYEEIEVTIWKLNVMWIFYTKWKEMTVGWKVIEWKAKNKCKFRILRWDEIIANWEILSLHKNKDEVKEITEWDECGMKVKVWKKIEEWDVLEFWEMQEVK